MIRPPTKQAFRVQNLPENRCILFTTKEKGLIETIEKGVIYNFGYDKIFKYFVIVYNPVTNEKYMYFNLDELITSNLENGLEIDKGFKIGYSESVAIRIYNQCMCEAKQFYYEYLSLVSYYNRKIDHDGFYS